MSSAGRVSRTSPTQLLQLWTQMLAYSGRNFRRVAQFDPEQSLHCFARSCHLPTAGGNRRMWLSHWKFE